MQSQEEVQQYQRSKLKNQESLRLVDIQQSEFNFQPEQIEHNKENNQIYINYLKKKHKKDAKKKYYTLQEMDEIKEEDKPFIILDKDTGKYLDIRIDEDELHKSSLFDTEIVQQEGDDENIWQEFWDKLREVQEEILEIAYSGEQIQILKQLKKASDQKLPIDINYKGFDDYTALHNACSEGNIDVVQVLIDNKANLDAVTIFKRTPMHLASLRGFTQVINLLIMKGANINCQDKSFFTPLHYACENGFLDTIDLLLRNNANVNLKTHQGMSAIELAQNIPKVWQIFQKFGHSKMQSNYNLNRKNYVDNMLQLNQKMQKMSTQSSLSNISQSTTDVEILKAQYDDFEFYDVLGKGAFGKVYLVKRKNVDNKNFYAMKMLNKDKIKQHNLVRYAKVEKNVMSIMNHPFIVRLHYAFQTNDGLFLVMQFCPGGDLSDLLDIKDKFDERTAKIYLAEVVLALEALHRNNIIFRDLKPANILLDAEGHALLADFGLANHIQESSDMNNLRQSFLGTPAYLAPEMVRKAGHNRMIDWYLLGVLLYEFLTGITPYYANTKEKLFENILKGPLKMPSKGISDNAKDLIVKLLNRNPKKRLGYQTDGEEIKQHPFFADIDWDKIYKKQYTMEKPQTKSLPEKPIQIQISDRQRQQVLNMEEWSFVDQSQK